MFYENQQFCPSLLFTGESLPNPPQQFAPSEALVTNLPKAFVLAAMKLFPQGLADPRGCEYVVNSLNNGTFTA